VLTGSIAVLLPGSCTCAAPADLLLAMITAVAANMITGLEMRNLGIRPWYHLVGAPADAASKLAVMTRTSPIRMRNRAFKPTPSASALSRVRFHSAHGVDLSEKSKSEAGRCVPQPIAGPSEAGAKTHTAQDRDRPGGGRDELSYPESQQVGRSAYRDQDVIPARQRRSPDHGDAEQEVTDHDKIAANPLMISTGEYWLMESNTAGDCLAKTGRATDNRLGDVAARHARR
jgi:hypothetical protein